MTTPPAAFCVTLNYNNLMRSPLLPLYGDIIGLPPRHRALETTRAAEVEALNIFGGLMKNRQFDALQSGVNN